MRNGHGAVLILLEQLHNALALFEDAQRHRIEIRTKLRMLLPHERPKFPRRLLAVRPH